MGFLDALLGRRKVAGPAKRDRLFAISTAYVTLQTSFGVQPRGVSALVFQPLATGDFAQIVSEMEEVVRSTGEETGTQIDTQADNFGYRWMILRDPDVEDLVVGVNAIAEELQTGGYGDRLLAAVFVFTDSESKPVYFIYNYKRGFWYPFVPAPGDQQRSVERELQLKAQIGGELPIEPELERWFPLWGVPI
jgi:PspAB-like protein